MNDVTTDYAEWIGRQETTDDDLSQTLALAAAAMLDDTQTCLGTGSALPPLWHWFYFLPRVPQMLLGIDGHPQRGGFMPPIPYPRRMFAGARMRFHHPLLIGQPARRAATIRDIRLKSGRSGKLAFVSVCYGYYQDDRLCIEEEQDIVYREPGPAVACTRMLDEWPPLPAGACARIVTPDPRLLFRFSALTFNAHRIHYDRPYAMKEEGYPGLVVHGPLTAVLLMELVRQEVARPVQEFSFRGLAPLFDLAPFRIVCTPVNERQCALEAQAPDGATAMRASVELAPVQRP